MNVKDFYQLDYWKLDGSMTSDEEDKEIRILARHLFPSNVSLFVNDFGMILDGCLEWNYPDGVMRAMSLAFPDVVFDLYWEDGDSIDSSHTYFVAGLHQFAVGHITYDEFDPNKLEK